MRLLNIDHVGIAVNDLDAALAEYERQYRVTALTREVVESQGVEEAMLPVGGSYVQLLGALSDDSPVGRFLAERGEGLHHIAYVVPSIQSALDHLRHESVLLVDEEPRIGGGGHQVAFVHPQGLTGTLIELVELNA